MGVRHLILIIVFILSVNTAGIFSPCLMAEESMSDEERGIIIEECTRQCLSNCPGSLVEQIDNVCKETVLLGTMLFKYPLSIDNWVSDDFACKVQCNSYAKNNGFGNDTEAINNCILNCKCFTDCASRGIACRNHALMIFNR